MRRVIIFTFLCFGLLNIIAQNKFDNFVVSGYRCVIIPSEKFMLKTSHPEWTKQYSEGKVLHIELTDATGRMPKDTLFIYTNDIKNLVLNFSTIEVSDALNVDSMNLTLAAGSRGEMNLSANLLEVNIGAGSKLTLSGDIKSIVGRVEGNSHLKGNNLIVSNTNLKVKGNSTADIQTFPLPSEKDEGIGTLTFCFLVTVIIISILSFLFHIQKKRKVNLLNDAEINDIEREIVMYKKTDRYITLIEKEVEINDEYMPVIEQKDLYDNLNGSFPELISTIRKAYPKMSLDDLYFCVLSSLDLKNKTIAFCMRTTIGALRTRKNRIKRDMEEETFQRIFAKNQ